MKKLIQGENVDFEVDNTLKIQIQKTDVDYEIHIYTVDPEKFITSISVWDDEIEAIRNGGESIVEEYDYEEEDF